MPRQSMTRNSLLLASFAVISTGIIAGTYLLTQDRIALEQRKAEEKALLEIVPRDRHDNVMLDDTLRVDASTPGLGLGRTRQIYLAQLEGKVVTAIVPATTSEGYSGDINLIIGVNADGSIAGLRILSHRETPGLGDKIDLKKSDWVLSFDGRSLGNPTEENWSVKKDGGVFDQFTGATITPRAVVAAVLKALRYAEAEKDALFAADRQDAGVE
ncbi:MAG: electron transport complex subunit RsxG [Halieaceae bacterium]|jgi:Na+-translocating ferredoxin:NAD+ oxidoreductase subunit G|nr:electron transport complex subunit RsxG [Halieaceae bacterium]